MGAGLQCSFCGKASSEVQTLIAGPSVTICDACVWSCVDILRERDPESQDADHPAYKARQIAESIWGDPARHVLETVSDGINALVELRKRLQNRSSIDDLVAPIERLVDKEAGRLVDLVPGFPIPSDVSLQRIRELVRIPLDENGRTELQSLIEDVLDRFGLDPNA
jgi:hypothetical protein